MNNMIKLSTFPSQTAAAHAKNSSSTIQLANADSIAFSNRISIKGEELFRPVIQQNSTLAENSQSSSYPIINQKQTDDDVLIQNANEQQSYWVPKGVAVDAARAATTGTNIVAEPVNSAGTQAVGATQDFVKNYSDMRDANTIGADKYFHCKANCEATQRGAAGEFTAETISNAREWIDMNIKGDPTTASADDQKANSDGRTAGQDNTTSCQTGCNTHRPSGLAPQY